MNTILVPIDFSHAAHAVLDRAKQPAEPGFVRCEPGPRHLRSINKGVIRGAKVPVVIVPARSK